jgi:hypothetical protein
MKEVPQDQYHINNIINFNHKLLYNNRLNHQKALHNKINVMIMVIIEIRFKREYHQDLFSNI